MCTLKNEHVPPNGNTRGYMYPQTEIWVGMLNITNPNCLQSLVNIGEEFNGKIGY